VKRNYHAIEKPGKVNAQKLGKFFQMLWPPVANQRFTDGILSGLDTSVAQFCKLCRISLSGENGIHNCQTRQPGDIADDMVNLQIHLRQRFVHMLDMLPAHLHQLVPVTDQNPHRADSRLRPEG